MITSRETYSLCLTKLTLSAPSLISEMSVIKKLNEFICDKNCMICKMNTRTVIINFSQNIYIIENGRMFRYMLYLPSKIV